ncbi:MAG: prolyl oligopeptidase family serine peptidase [Bacteroidota bacterium]
MQSVIKLLLINVALLLFLLGLFFTLDGNLQAGAILMLGSGTILLGNYLVQLVQLFRRSKLWTWQTLAFSGAVFVLAIIFMHGFSASMGMMMVYSVRSFTSLYLVAGLLLPILLFFVSRKSADEQDKRWITVGVAMGSLLGLAGLLGFAGIIPFPVQTILYSWVFLLFFYVVFLVKKYRSSNEQVEKQESLSLLLLSLLFLAFWVIRFVLSPPLEEGLLKAVLHVGFIPLLILPLSILSVKKLYPYIVFLFYFVLLDCYFIQFDPTFNYLVETGINGCEGYDQATDYPVNPDPGMPLSELMKEPSQEELDEILAAWQAKDFSPQNIQIVHQAAMFNGDSLTIISHAVNGLTHYGAIRIPQGLEVAQAPILMELEGGGTGVDVSKLRPLSHGSCQKQSAQFISILPAYRGCILRGDDFCFRSEGYAGDPWLGPAEDAVAFLEAVKALYQKSDTTRVLARGISRGATVALIMGSLTDKLDYIIATSTHTKFLDAQVVQNERVGQSFARAFYTPTAPPAHIRKRIIASSPYFFADKLPPFELHQGARDEQTTIWHARVLEDRLKKMGRDKGTYHVYQYEAHGHGYADQRTVCQALADFIQQR